MTQNSEVRKAFISSLIENERPCHVYLVNGIKLNGTITKQDDVCVILSNSTDQVINLSAISTINPISAL